VSIVTQNTPIAPVGRSPPTKFLETRCDADDILALPECNLISDVALSCMPFQVPFLGRTFARPQDGPSLETLAHARGCASLSVPINRDLIQGITQHHWHPIRSECMRDDLSGSF